MIAPESFAALIAFPPVNEHLLHDAGAFQIGIGTSLAVALVWPDAIGVALVGFLVADALHAANHARDVHLGGHLGDVWFLGGLAVAALVALLLHLRRPERTPHESHPGRGHRRNRTPADRGASRRRSPGRRHHPAAGGS